MKFFNIYISLFILFFAFTSCEYFKNYNIINKNKKCLSDSCKALVYMDSISHYIYLNNTNKSNEFVNKLNDLNFKNIETSNFLNNIRLDKAIEIDSFDNTETLLQQALQNTTDVRLNGYNKAKSLNTIGKYYLKKEHINEARTQFTKALPLLSHNDSLSLLCRANILNNIGICYDKQEKISYAENYYRMSLETFREAHLMQSITAVEAMHNLSEILRYRGAISESIYWIELALSINKKHKNEKQKHILQHALAAAHRSIGNYDYAMLLYNNCIHYFKKINDEENEIRSEIGLAIANINKGNFATADSILSILNSKKMNEANEIKLLESKHYLAQESGNKNQSIEILKLLLNKNELEKYSYFGEIADNYLSLKDTSNAAFWANESEEWFKKNKEKPNDLWLVTLFVKAKISNNPNEILSLLNSAESITINDIKENYTPENIIHPIGFLETKKLFFDCIKINKIKLNEEKIELEIEKVYEYIASVQQTLINDAETIDFINISNDLTNTIIDIYSHLYSIKNDEKYINSIIKWNEHRKAILLRKNIKKSKSINFQNDKLNKIESEIFELKTMENTDSIKNIIAQKQLELYDLNKKNFNEITLKNYFANPSIFKSQIPNNTSILYYINTYENSIVISCDNVKLLLIKNNVNTISKTEIEKLKSTSIETFIETSYKFYNILFRMVEPNLKENIIVISDEKTENIPFEILVKANNIMPFRMLDYLNNHYAFGYNFSVSTYLENNNIAGNNSTVAYFAPIDFTSFSNLQGSKDELESIRREIQVNPFLKEQSTIQNFTSSKYSFIHLAAHSIINPYQAEMSYIQMFQSKNDDGKLYIKDIYNLKMQKDLLYLASCNNAKGKSEYFEGNISIARAFIQAGFQNIIATFWEISDAEASLISGKFYKYLRKDENKLKALQKAKIDYVKNSSEIMAAPKFWGSYHMLANKNEIRVHKGFSSVIQFLFIIGIPIILFLIIQIFPKNNQ
jgi:CHAT domain-containing protein